MNIIYSLTETANAIEAHSASTKPIHRIRFEACSQMMAATSDHPIQIMSAASDHATSNNEYATFLYDRAKKKQRNTQKRANKNK